MGETRGGPTQSPPQVATRRTAVFGSFWLHLLLQMVLVGSNGLVFFLALLFELYATFDLSRTRSERTKMYVWDNC